MIRTLTVLVLLAASACGPSRLEELRGVTLKISTEVSLWLSVNAEGTPGTGCPKLEETVTATVDGVPMKRLTAGGPSTPSPVQPEPVVCMAPTFDAKDFREDGGVAQFVLSDGSATFVTQLTRPRTVRALALAGGTLHPSERATVVWPYDNESLNQASITLTLWDVDAGTRSLLPAPALVVEASQVSFLVPSGQAAGRVRLLLESNDLVLRPCEGPSSCVLDHAIGSLDVSVVP